MAWWDTTHQWEVERGGRRWRQEVEGQEKSGGREWEGRELLIKNLFVA